MFSPIGAQIRALRTARKLTQKNLALLSGISQQHLSHLERGRGGIELATLSKLLDALDCEFSFVPRPTTTAAALAARKRQWERFAAWEATSGRRPPGPGASPPGRGSLARAGAFADFFLSRHKTRPAQHELRARAERVRAWRELLARVRPAAP